jgi:hypothetical protein
MYNFINYSLIDGHLNHLQFAFFFLKDSNHINSFSINDHSGLNFLFLQLPFPEKSIVCKHNLEMVIKK